MKQTGINLEMVKKRNRDSILRFLNQAGPISRKDIATALGLTPAAVTQICGEFMTGGLLVEKGIQEEESRAGRKKVLVDINYKYRWILGINIETERTSIALADLAGQPAGLKELPTEHTMQPEQFLHKIASVCREMIAEAGKKEMEIVGVGVGITGLVDRENGKSIHAYGIWNEEVPVASILGKELNLPVILENNVTCFALAELIYGIGREKDNLLFVKWGPGVGSAIVADNKIYEGRNGKAAELGHYIIEKDGKPCTCGRKGCLETKISTHSLKAWLKENLSREETPNWYEILNGNADAVNLNNLGELLEHMDPKVKQYAGEAMDRFARAIINCMTILAPNRVILFGPMFRFPSLREQLIADCSYYDESYNASNIIYTELSEREAYIGPIALFVGEYLYGM